MSETHEAEQQDDEEAVSSEPIPAQAEFDEEDQANSSVEEPITIQLQTETNEEDVEIIDPNTKEQIMEEESHDMA